MAEKVLVKAEKREGRGKNDSRRLRVAGLVPVSIYGGDAEPVVATAKLADLAAILRTESGPSAVFTIDVEGVGASDVIFQERQIHPLKGRLMHADLRRVRKGEKIEVTVPVHVIGEAPGVKISGGVLTLQMHEVKIFCTPGKIPEFIGVDVSALEANSAIHVKELTLPEGIEIHEAPEAVVVFVGFAKNEVETPTEEAAE